MTRRQAILIALVVLAILGAIVLGRCSAPSARDAVALDRADAVVEAANRVMHAERAATANQTDRDDAFRNQQDELKEVAREADNGAGVGPATAGVLERLREQQAKGRGGSPAR